MQAISMRFWAAVFGAVFLMAVAGAAAAAEIQWFGQSAVKITTPGGKVIMIDPFITKNPKTPADQKDLNKLGKVDLILVAHGHGDHVGDTVALAKMTGAKVALTRAVNRLIELQLVRRKTDEADRRSVLIQRTVRGSVFLRELGELIVAAARQSRTADETGLPPRY
jgi:glyoxylase-like metal-dependent hydrolase (beta-lactamase superfamily II)